MALAGDGMITQANRLTPERDFLISVVALAQAKRWLVAHFRHGLTSRTDKNGKSVWVTPLQGDGAGYPDLTMVRGNRLLFAELKSEKGEVSKEQRRWLDALSICSEGTFLVEVYIWRPHDWQAIVEILEARE